MIAIPIIPGLLYQVKGFGLSFRVHAANGCIALLVLLGIAGDRKTPTMQAACPTSEISPPRSCECRP